MGMIGRLSTVNGGTIVDTNYYSVEVLGPGFSTHKDMMVVAYAPEGNVKVSMVYDGHAFYVYRFRNHLDTQHYWSRKYSKEYVLHNKKYRQMAEICIMAAADLFNR